jgi:hypothetical protein
MKKLLLSLMLSALGAVPLMTTYASPSLMSLGDFLTVYIDHFDDDIPDSYEYIALQFPNISPEDELYPVLQKAVYIDMIQNIPVAFDPDSLIYQKHVAAIIAAHRGRDISYTDSHANESYVQDIIEVLP